MELLWGYYFRTRRVVRRSVLMIAVGCLDESLLGSFWESWKVHDGLWTSFSFVWLLVVFGRLGVDVDEALRGLRLSWISLPTLGRFPTVLGQASLWCSCSSFWV